MLVEEALTVARAWEWEDEVVSALGFLGQPYAEAGRYDEARAHCHEAVALARQRGDKQAEGQAIDRLGRALNQEGRGDEAVQATLDAIALSRRYGPRSELGVQLSNLALLYANMGRIQEATGLGREALAIYEQLDDPGGVASRLSNLGYFTAVQELREEAIEHMDRALRIMRRLGLRMEESGLLINYGNTLKEARRPEEANAAYRRGLGIAEAAGYRLIALRNALGLADTAVQLDDAAESIHWGERAVALAGELGQRREACFAHIILSKARRDARDAGGARRDIEAAHGLALELANPLDQALVLIEWVQLDVAAADREAAVARMRDLRSIVAGMPDGSHAMLQKGIAECEAEIARLEA